MPHDNVGSSLAQGFDDLGWLEIRLRSEQNSDGPRQLRSRRRSTRKQRPPIVYLRSIVRRIIVVGGRFVLIKLTARRYGQHQVLGPSACNFLMTDFKAVVVALRFRPLSGRMVTV